eukprot:169564_1
MLYRLVTALVLNLKFIAGEWTLFDTLPQANDEFASGVYNGTIFLLGGTDTKKQVTEYDINTETFTGSEQKALSLDIWGGGQYWTQQENMIYIIYYDKTGTDNDYLVTYNMINRQFTNNWMTFAQPKVTFYGCLASSKQYLFTTGGLGETNVLKEIAILDLASEPEQWLNNPPNMIKRRFIHACVVHNNYLWAFGGSSDYPEDWPPATQLTSNERISVTDILAQSWAEIDPLTIGLGFLRAIGWHDTIFVLGGWNYDNSMNNIYKTIHLVNASSGSVSISQDEFPMANAFGAPIIYKDTLYVFGGFSVGVMSNRWAYKHLVTANPTMNPSYIPTQYPTIHPTISPIKAPTNHPVIMTNDPSQYPTVHPVTFSTEIMTNDPSRNPTASPFYPSIIPTANPTVYPSKRSIEPPSHLHSESPSVLPTDLPSINPSAYSSTIGITEKPSLLPSFNPFSRTETTSSDITQFMISITFNDCLQNCNVTKDEINNILIAYIGDSVILDTDIVDNEITVIVSLVATEFNELDKDAIARGIEKDLEVKYGNVDVNMDENENDNENESEHVVKTEKNQVPTILVVILVMLYAIISCIYCKRKRKERKQLFVGDIRQQQNMIENPRENIQRNIVAQDRRTDDQIVADELDEGDQDVDDINIDDVAQNDDVGVTQEGPDHCGDILRKQSTDFM